MRQSIVLIFLCLSTMSAQTKRALVVGINEYQTRISSPSSALQVSDAIDKPHVLVTRPPVTGKKREGFDNLKGAVPDAEAYRQMLIDIYQVPPENIVFLTDKKNANDPNIHANGVATAQRILDTFESLLIEPAKAGDISIFIYAGHGSRMENDASAEYDKRDQTIVPADSEDGTPDIRDKELVRLYKAASDKKILLTVISDSCHSGGLSRGPEPPPVTRFVRDDPHIAHDPIKIDSETTIGSGYMLFIASALDTQGASEIVDPNGHDRGAFSYYFQKAIRDNPYDPVDRVFQHTLQLMRGAAQMQTPVKEGELRFKSSLFGEPASGKTGISAIVQGVDGNQITLRGGRALGLEQGCELLLNGSKNGIRIRITKPPKLATSVAEVISPAGAVAKVEQTFMLDRWIVSADSMTAFYLPTQNLPMADDLANMALTIRSAAKAWTWIDDPTLTTPAAVIRYENGAWLVERRDGASISTRSLGAHPNANDWSGALRDPLPGGLFANFPPSSDLSAAVRAHADAGTNAVRFVENHSSATYSLTGRVLSDNRSLEYAWVLRNVDQSDEGKTPLPVRYNWFRASDPNSAGQLQQDTLNIARLRLWLTISVPGGGTNPFPYRLVLRNSATHEERLSGAKLVEGEKYDIVLKKDDNLAHSAAADSIPQWIYLATINQEGRMRALFPKYGNSGANHLPSGDQSEITLMKDVLIQAPYGTDTLILIASKDEEIEPSLLTIDPATRGGEHEAIPVGRINNLLFNIRGAKRDFADPPPSDFGLERLTFQSVKKQ